MEEVGDLHQLRVGVLPRVDLVPEVDVALADGKRDHGGLERAGRRPDTLPVLVR